MTKFDQLAAQSKVWIYTSERDFTVTEIKVITDKAMTFVTEWESHGKSVKGLIEVRYNRFILIYADDEGDTMCGRAMDSSVRFIKELEQELKISLMDRMLIAYKTPESIATVNLTAFQELISKGVISENTVVFNNLLQHKAEIDSHWEVPVKHSWHSKLISS